MSNSNVDTNTREDVVAHLSMLLIDDPKTRAYVRNYLLTHEFEPDFEEGDGSTPAGEIWYQRYSEELQSLMREMSDNLIHDPK